MAEIHRMSSIYKNATAVISAATASDASEGFLRKDRSDLARNNDYEATASAGRVTIDTNHSRGASLQTDPLYSRAWAYQEHLFSRRTFIFSFYELSVKYQISTAPRPLRPNLSRYIPRHVPSLTSWDWHSPKSFSLWANLIFRYSQGRLSKPEDRLNAFQGIADEMEALSGIKVYYGIPVVAWPITLAWDARTRGKTRSPRAPS